MKIFKSLLSVTLFWTLFSISSSVQAHVLDGAKEWNGHYYKVIAMPMTWKKADDFCQSMGGHLAAAENREENELIKTVVVKYNKDYNSGRSNGYWMGGYSKDGIWKWVTGKAIVDYVDWKKSQTFKHMMMYIDSDGVYWSTYLSDSNLLFVCEWEKAEDAHDSTL